MRLHVLGNLDPQFAWDDECLLRDTALEPSSPMPKDIRGALGSVSDGPDQWRLVRDPLGLNKLFWVRESPSSVIVAARPHRLVAEGFPFTEIRAFPRGCVADVGAEVARCETNPIVPEQHPVTNVPPIAEIGASIRNKLDAYIVALASAHPQARAFVCCSGGLDSSGILSLVAQHFTDVVAVSFDIERPRGSASEDRRVARQLCQDVDVPLIETTVTPEQLLEHLDTVLVEGCDWRDFNVHAALVNAVLADSIAHAGHDEAIVFTGDLANEFLADYHEETYCGARYYRLPQLAPSVLRDSLVAGLDTCHREVGVFGAWHLQVVQPYAVAVDSYLQLPDGFLGRADAKPQLCQAIFGDLVPKYIFDRPKVRAQIGDAHTGGGVLSICVDRGINQDVLRSRFARLHGVDDVTQIDRFMRAGRYRSAVPFAEEEQ